MQTKETLDFYRERLNSLTPYALAVLRIVTALLFMEHGLQKLILFPAPSEHGTPEPWTLVWFGGWIEAAGGFLLAAGLLTRAVAFVTAGEMAVAYWMVHAPAGFYPVLNHGELAILYCFVFLLFVFAGGGAWSLDGLLMRRAPKAHTTEAAMRTFELRVYTLRTGEALDYYTGVIYPRHLDSFPLFGIEAHGFWTAKADVEPRLFVLVSYAADQEPGEVARRYMQSAAFADEIRGFDVASIVGVDSTVLTPLTSSPLK